MPRLCNAARALIVGSATTLTAAAATAAPVDLSSWSVNGYTGGTVANWTVENPPANDSVFQSENSEPSFFFDTGAFAQGMSLSGEITVTQSVDDDFIGFVLGYQDGELSSASADFLLVDWKQATQVFDGVTGEAGIAISRVSGDLSGIDSVQDTLDTYWAHEGPVEELQRGATLGTTGWIVGQTYSFDVVFTSTLVEVFVDGVRELSLTATDAGVAAFDDGAFGFYNYSQATVRYAGIEEAVVVNPVPAPGAIALFGVGLLGLAARRARRRA